MIRNVLVAAIALFTLTSAVPPDINNASQITPSPPVVVTPSPISAPSGPQDLGWNDQQRIFAYGVRSIADQCAVQPAVLWCSKIELVEKTLSAYEIIDGSLKVKEKFVYTNDVVDNWRVHSRVMLEGHTWFGDCDDLTSTTLDMLIRAGQPRHKIWMVLVNTTTKGMFDHLVGMVQDDVGKFWIVGDTSSQNAYPVDRIKYRVVGVARGDQMKQWMDPRIMGVFPEKSLQSKLIALP